MNNVKIEANEMIEELTNRIAQLTLDNIVKDMVIRKLQDQSTEEDTEEEKEGEEVTNG